MEKTTKKTESEFVAHCVEQIQEALKKDLVVFVGKGEQVYDSIIESVEYLAKETYQHTHK